LYSGNYKYLNVWNFENWDLVETVYIKSEYDISKILKIDKFVVINQYEGL